MDNQIIGIKNKGIHRNNKKNGRNNKLDTTG